MGFGKEKQNVLIKAKAPIPRDLPLAFFRWWPLTHWLLLTLHIEIDPGWTPLEEVPREGGVSRPHRQKKSESAIDNFLKGGAAYHSQISTPSSPPDLGIISEQELHSHNGLNPDKQQFCQHSNASFQSDRFRDSILSAISGKKKCFKYFVCLMHIVSF